MENREIAPEWQALENAARDLTALCDLIVESQDHIGPIRAYLDSVRVDPDVPVTERTDRIIHGTRRALRRITDQLVKARNSADPIRFVESVTEDLRPELDGLEESQAQAVEALASMRELAALLDRADGLRLHAHALVDVLDAAPEITAKVREWAQGLARIQEMQDPLNSLRAAIAQLQQATANANVDPDGSLGRIADVINALEDAMKDQEPGTA